MRCVPWALVLFALPGMAGAHTGDHGTLSFIAGCAHPFTGLDHLLAMLGVGVIAARTAGAARGWLPLSFLGAMAFGGALAVAGLPLPWVETMIALSVVFTCAAILMSLRMPTHLTAALVAMFAVFHGYTHGTEMAATASALGYGAGCLTGAALLLGIGFFAGQLRPLAAEAPKDASMRSDPSTTAR